jgi:small subunit ribosomal protein S20
MANTKAAKKALRVSERKNEINRNRKSRYRTFVKKVENLIADIHSSKSEEVTQLVTKAKDALKKMESEIMKAVKFGIIKKNTASRKLSRSYKSLTRAQELSSAKNTEKEQ